MLAIGSCIKLTIECTKSPASLQDDQQCGSGVALSRTWERWQPGHLALFQFPPQPGLSNFAQTSAVNGSKLRSAKGVGQQERCRV